MSNRKGKYYKEFLKLRKKLDRYWEKADHKTVKGQKYERLYKELWNKMWSNEKFHPFLNKYDGSYPRHKGRTKKRDDSKKFKNGTIEDIYIEKIPKEYEY